MDLSLEEAIAKVKHYFAHEQKGGLVSVDEIVALVDGEWDFTLQVMKSLGCSPEFKYIVRHTCPEMHNCETDGWCEECDYRYPANQVGAMQYLGVAKGSGIKPLVFSDSEAPKYLDAVRSVVPDMGALTAYAIAETVLKASRS